MGKETKIQWADSTLNLSMGCAGCELWNLEKGVRHCYAGTLVERYKGKKGFPLSFAQPTRFDERIHKGLAWKDLTGCERPDGVIPKEYPRIIFVNDLGDTFTEDLPIDWMADHVDRMAESKHVWILLTKRPSRMIQFFQQWTSERERPVPSNVWLLVTVTSTKALRRVQELQKSRALGAKTIGVSCEPMLESIDFRPYLENDHSLDWIIVGGESGNGARPFLIHWIQSVHYATIKKTGVECALFVKQLGAKVGIAPSGDEIEASEFFTVGGLQYVQIPFNDSHGGDPQEWPSFVSRRREFPSYGQKETKGKKTTKANARS